MMIDCQSSRNSRDSASTEAKHRRHWSLMILAKRWLEQIGLLCRNPPSRCGKSFPHQTKSKNRHMALRRYLYAILNGHWWGWWASESFIFLFAESTRNRYVRPPKPDSTRCCRSLIISKNRLGLPGRHPEADVQKLLRKSEIPLIMSKLQFRDSFSSFVSGRR